MNDFEGLMKDGALGVLLKVRCIPGRALVVNSKVTMPTIAVRAA